MKKFLLLAALACGCLSAMAQTVGVQGCLSKKDNVKEGMFEFVAEGVEAFRDVQFDIQMPQGLSIVTHDDGGEQVLFSNGSLCSPKHGADGNDLGKGHYRMVMFAYPIRTFSTGKGSIVRFKVVADDTFKSGDIIISDVQFSGDGIKFEKDKETAIAVPVKISNEILVATIVSPYEIALPTDVKAEEGSDNGSVVTVDEKNATSTLVAGVPSFIFGAKVDATYYGVQSVEAPSKGKVLTGTFADQQISSGYVLQGGKLRNVNAPVTLPAYKAYIAGGAGVKEFSLNGVTTGITVNEAINGEQVIYNVAGQRLNKTQKGVNIVNGKKYIVK